MIDNDLYDIHFHPPASADKFIAALKKELLGWETFYLKWSKMDGISLTDKKERTQTLLVVQEIMRRLNLKKIEED